MSQDIQVIKTKQFFLITNEDSSSNDPNNLRIQFNNPNVSSVPPSRNSKTYLTPCFLSITFSSDNISEEKKNNKYTVTVTPTTGNAMVSTFIIPDGTYTGSSLLNVVKAHLQNSIRWVSGNNVFMDFSASSYDAITNKITLSRAPPASAIPSQPTVSFNFKPTGYDASQVFGVDSLQLAYDATNAVTFTAENVIDLQSYEVIQLRSNIAKSTFQKVNGILSPTDILLLIPTDNINTSGGLLQWSPMDTSLYRQEVNGDCDYMTLSLTDLKNKSVGLKSKSQVSFSFILEREFYPQSVAEKMQSVQEYVNWN